MTYQTWGWIILALSLACLLIPAYRSAVRKRNRYTLGKPHDDPRNWSQQYMDSLRKL